MAFFGGLASGLFGMFGQQQANNQSVNAQNAAQQNAQQFAAGQNQQARAYDQQALQQALQNLAMYQRQNPAPIQGLGAIQGPPQGPQQPTAQPPMPTGGMHPQQNLQGAFAQPPMPQGPPQGAQAQSFPRLQALYPLIQQMLASRQAQPLGNRSQGVQ